VCSSRDPFGLPVKVEQAAQLKKVINTELTNNHNIELEATFELLVLDLAGDGVETLNRGNR
jgi:hypothetical protein